MSNGKRRGVAGLVMVACGTLSSACGSDSGGGVVEPAADTVRLLDVQAEVFSPRCALSGCHIGPDPPRGLDLSAGQSAGNLVGVASDELPAFLRVEPSNAADSYLYMKVTADPRIFGDPMPLTGGPLSDADLDLIQRWIEEGAL